MISKQILDNYGVALFLSASSVNAKIREKNLAILKNLETTHPSIQTEYRNYVEESQIIREGARRKGKEN